MDRVCLVELSVVVAVDRVWHVELTIVVPVETPSFVEITVVVSVGKDGELTLVEAAVAMKVSKKLT